MKKRIVLFFLCLTLLFSLSACSKRDEATEARLETGARGVIDCFLAGDAEGAFALVSGAEDKEAFLTASVSITEMLTGVQEYTLERLSGNRDGDITSLSFRMTATVAEEEVTYLLTASEKTGTEGLYNFYIQRNAPTPSGALTNMKGADAWQWILVIVGGLTWVFTVVAAIDCYKNAKKSRGMMLFLILFGLVTVSVTALPEFALAITHGYRFPYSALLRHASGEVTVKALLPLGAIGYFLLRRHFTTTDE